ncbi:MAG: cation-transporting P-type ATPase [Nitrospirota bacterium]
MVQTLHTSVAGRARFKVDGLYRSQALKGRLESGLLSKKGISAASANPLTGNLLVIFNSGNSPETIAGHITLLVSAHGNGPRAPSAPQPSAAARRDLSPEAGEAGKLLSSRRKLRTLVVHAEEQEAEAWHTFSSGEVVRRFSTSKETGLSPEAAFARLKRYGPNVLPEAVPRSGLSILLGQFTSLPTALLGAAAALSVATGGVADALVIAGVLSINATIGYLTESQAEKTIHSLKRLVRPSALVIRENAYKEVPAENIVAGDILVLRPGSYVAADSRLIEANHLSVDESTLTGESLPVIKAAERLGDRSLPLGDRVNMVYRGTLVTGGQGLAVVVATGKFTEIGQIQSLVGEARPPETPLERQLDRMGAQLVMIGGAVCGVVFIIGLLRGYGFLQMLKTSISLAVAAVPEGLPTVATTTLALGIRTMRRHNVLIRHLEAVETLGSVQTICLDKTGTITMNRMTVVRVHTGMRRIEAADGSFVSPEGAVNPYSSEELLRLIHVAVLCNESEIEVKDCAGDEPAGGCFFSSGTGSYLLRGSPTEMALMHMALSAGVDIIQLRDKLPLVKVTHRSENRNYMTTSHRFLNGGSLTALKGSPNEVLALCRWHIRDGKRLELSDGDREAIQTENERMAGDALRVLGVAYSYAENGSGTPDDGPISIWLGLVGMADPTRKGVRALMGTFHRAGVETVMITGDQSPTAYAIGKELDLSNGGQLEILDSTHLNNIDPEVMKALCERVHVFARVSPAHKLQIVQALQRAGKVVAMTGDGINDGPALKAADIGVAMGHTGTDVAREVADVVLEDDNLETMIIAVSQGRTIYNNIRKSVHFLLSTNLSEIMVMFAAIAGGMGQPLNAMQLLWINLVSDIFPGLALALEPPEPDVLSKPPRNPNEPIMNNADLRRIVFESAVMSASSLGAYGYGLLRYSRGHQAGTMAFMSLTLAQLLHAVSCRSEHHTIFDKRKLPPNRILDGALGLSLGLQGLTLLVPGLRGLLGLAPVTIIDGAIIGGSALLPFLVNESTKKSGSVHSGKGAAP